MTRSTTRPTAEDNRDGTDYNYSWNCCEEGQSRKKKTLELRSRQLRNALVMLYLGQGVPVLYGGRRAR